MNRFVKCTRELIQSEDNVSKFTNISICDDSNNMFKNISLLLTTHRIILELNSNMTYSMNLSLIKSVETTSTSSKLYREKLHLNPPQYPSSFRTETNFINIDHKKSDFKAILQNTLRKAQWNIYSDYYPSSSLVHVGIGGIERAKKAQFEEDGQAINTAFGDLKNLMELASTMTQLSRNLSAKLETKTPSQEKETSTVAFRSMLLSIGIDNPVTRGGSNYHRELAQQLHDFLLPLVEQMSGVISLTEAFCYYNRARSMSLISPQDMVSAVENFSNIRGQKLFLKKFASGSSVLQSNCLENKIICQQVGEDVKKEVKVTVEGYAERKGIPVFLARERLREAEDEGTICRDESEEGVQYYWNIF